MYIEITKVDDTFIIENIPSFVDDSLAYGEAELLRELYTLEDDKMIQGIVSDEVSEILHLMYSY